MVLRFGGSDNSATSFNKARFVILPVPYENHVSYKKGTQKGPVAILKASDKIELFDDELSRETYKVGINTRNLLDVSGLNPERMIKAVKGKVMELAKKDKIPVVLGGEHSVSIGSVLALKELYKDLSVLYFDSHYDLRDKYGDSKYNHACVARRISEVVSVVEVGVRSLSKEEKDFLDMSNSIKIINMEKISKDPNWYKEAKKKLSKNVYITIDLDVFDPSIMPSVGTPEPGGIGWYEFLRGIKNIIHEKNIVGFDVVELCPDKNIIYSDFSAAKLIYKIMGYITLQ